jgi:hypothetical protein
MEQSSWPDLSDQRPRKLVRKLGKLTVIHPSKNKEAQNRASMIQIAALKSSRLAQSNRSRFGANLGVLQGPKIRERETDYFERIYIKYA